MLRRLSTIIVLISCVVSLGLIPLSYAQNEFHECPKSAYAIPTESACGVLMHCVNELDRWDSCIQPTTLDLVQACRSENLEDCEIRAAYYALILFNVLYGTGLSPLADNAISDLLEAIHKADQGDIDTAILLFENVTLDLDYVPEYALELGLGLLHLQQGDLEDALEQFNKSIALEYDNPLAYYFRGLVYRQLGNEDYAIPDFYTYDAMVDLNLKRFLPLSSFSLRFSELESWMVYPVFGHSTYGYEYEDRTLNTAYPILISWLNDGKILAVSDLMQRKYEQTPKILFLEQDETNPTRYLLDMNQQDYGGLSRETYYLSVNVLPNRITFYAEIWHSEGIELIGSTVLPSTEANIRDTVENRPCDGLALSFIEIGDRLRQSYWEPIRLLDEPPANTGMIELTDKDFDDPKNGVTVLEGPVCYDNQVWWQVSNGEVSGWIAESRTESGDVWKPDEITSYYNVMPEDLVASWKDGIPSPMQFLGLSTSSE